MQVKSRRRVLAVFAAVAAPVIVASAAFACQSLATLRANPNSGPAGTVVTLTGNNYSGSASASPITIRLDSRTGPILASIPPTSRFTVTVNIPATNAGYHTLLATQYTASGAPVAGTPGRASFQVTGGAASADTSPIVPSALLTPLGLAGLALSGALVLRRRRSAPVA